MSWKRSFLNLIAGNEFAKLRAMRAMRVSVVYVPTCQRVKSVQTSHFYVPTSQRPANFSTSLTKRRTSFSKEFLFLNFSIMVNICRFLEHLSNCRKFISRNKESKFWHLQNLIKEKPHQPKTFNIVFNRARRFNRTIIRLVQNGAEYRFLFTYLTLYAVCKKAYLEKYTCTPQILVEEHSSCISWLRVTALSQAVACSRLQLFFKIGVLKNFANFTGKHSVGVPF